MGWAWWWDPGRNPRRYLWLAAVHGLRIGFTADTHLHADFVSGGRELAGLGARLLAPAGAGLAFPHEGLCDGQELDLGGLTLRALATPGHTPEHLSYLLLDGRAPVAVFTGGALIVGGVARTGLGTPGVAGPWARTAYASARKLLGLPASLAVYPTHGPGSFCAAAGAGDRTTTIGREKAANPLLAGADEDAFTARLHARLGSYPAYFGWLPAVNRRGELDGGIPAWQEAGLETASITLAGPGAASTLNGRRVLDVRQDSEWQKGTFPAPSTASLASSPIRPRRPACPMGRWRSCAGTGNAP